MIKFINNITNFILFPALQSKKQEKIAEKNYGNSRHAVLNPVKDCDKIILLNKRTDN